MKSRIAQTARSSRTPSNQENKNSSPIPTPKNQAFPFPLRKERARRAPPPLYMEAQCAHKFHHPIPLNPPPCHNAPATSPQAQNKLNLPLPAPHTIVFPNEPTNPRFHAKNQHPSPHVDKRTQSNSPLSRPRRATPVHTAQHFHRIFAKRTQSSTWHTSTPQPGHHGAPPRTKMCLNLPKSASPEKRTQESIWHTYGCPLLAVHSGRFRRSARRKIIKQSARPLSLSGV